MKYSVGDKLKVVDCKTNHAFTIGEEIEVKSIHGEYYRCKGRWPFHFYLTAQEVVRLTLN